MSRQPHYPYIPPPPSSQPGPSRSQSTTSTLPPEIHLPPPSSSFYTPTQQPPNSRTPSSTSSVFAFRPPYLPAAPRPRSSTSESPTKSTSDQVTSTSIYRQQTSARPRSVGTARSRVSGGFSQHEHENEHEAIDHGITSDEGDEEGEQQKLAIKREKNRIKQQKLRLRRANHISELETSLEKAQNDYKDLQILYEASLKKEQGLQRYIYSLEGMLRRYGLQGELDTLQGGPGLGGGVKREVEEGMDSALPRKRRKTTDTDLPRYTESSDTKTISTTYPQHTAPDDLRQPLPSAHTRPTRPRTSTSSFPPLRLTQTQTPEALSAPSPRSIRIADLLSPSLTTQSFQADPNLPPDKQFELPLLDTGWRGTETVPEQVMGEVEETGQVVVSPRPLGGVAMRYGESSDSLGGQSSAISVIEGYLDGNIYPMPRDVGLGGDTGLPLPPLSTPLTLPPPPYSAPSPSTISHPPPHPSVHSARVLLRAMLASNPTSTPHCTLPPLTPDHQKILLNAIYNLTTPSFRDQVNAAQIRNMPPLLMKSLMAYSHSSAADLRVVLMPIAILRARIVGFLKDGLPFDVTAFISHVLSDALVFGDTADPDSWEMSDEFWDVWGGWFKAGRTYCKSLSKWRRRFGHKGASVVDILLGTEGEKSRMKEVLIGRPEGWKRPEVLPPDKEMLASSNKQI